MYIIEERRLTPRGEIIQRYQVLGCAKYETACRELQRNEYDYLKENRWRPVLIGKADIFRLMDGKGYTLEQVVIENTERQ